MKKANIKGSRVLGTFSLWSFVPIVAALVWGYICVPLVAIPTQLIFRENPLSLYDNFSNFVFGVPLHQWWIYMFENTDSVPIFLGVCLWAATLAVLVYFINPTFIRRATAMFGPGEEKNHSHGSAHVDMKPTELKDSCATWKPGEKIPYEGGGRGFVYGTSKDGRSYVSSGQSHFFVWGPPGTGKTRNLLEPSITYMTYANPKQISDQSALRLYPTQIPKETRVELCDNKGYAGGKTLYRDEEDSVWESENSMGDHIICTDPKGELFSAQRRNLLRNGYNVLVFDLKNPDRSMQYNPLWLITRTYRSIRATADSLVSSAIEQYSASTQDGVVEGEKDEEFRAAIARADAIYQRAEAKADELSMDLAECIVHVNQESDGAFWGNSARYYICAWINFVATYDRDAYVKQYQALMNRVLSEGNRTAADKLAEQIAALPPAIEDTQRNLASVYHCIATHDNKETQSVFNFLPSEHPVRMNYAQMEKSEGTTEMNIRSSALSAIKQNINETFRQISATSDFNLEDFGREDCKLALFIITDDTKESANVPAVMLINQLYQTACATADSLGGTCKRRIHFILEELPNLGIAIPRLDSAMAMCRSRNIWFYLVAQDVALLRKRYGPKADEELMAPINTICFLATNNKATAKDISERLGDMTIKSESNNRSSGMQALSGRSGETTSLTSRAWMDSAEVLKFNAKNLGLLVIRKDPDVMPKNYCGVCNPAIFPFPDLSKTPFDKIIGLGNKSHQAKWALADSQIDNAVGRPRPKVWRGGHISTTDSFMTDTTNSFVPSKEVASAINESVQTTTTNGALSLELSEKLGIIKPRNNVDTSTVCEQKTEPIQAVQVEKPESKPHENLPETKSEPTKTSVKQKTKPQNKTLSGGALKRLIDPQMETVKDFVCPKTKEIFDELATKEKNGAGTFDRKEFYSIKNQELRAWQARLNTEITKDSTFQIEKPTRLFFEKEMYECFSPDGTPTPAEPIKPIPAKETPTRKEEMPLDYHFITEEIKEEIARTLKEEIQALTLSNKEQKEDEETKEELPIPPTPQRFEPSREWETISEWSNTVSWDDFQVDSLYAGWKPVQ